MIEEVNKSYKTCDGCFKCLHETSFTILQINFPEKDSITINLCKNCIRVYDLGINTGKFLEREFIRKALNDRDTRD